MAAGTGSFFASFRDGFVQTGGMKGAGAVKEDLHRLSFDRVPAEIIVAKRASIAKNAAGADDPGHQFNILHRLVKSIERNVFVEKTRLEAVVFVLLHPIRGPRVHAPVSPPVPQPSRCRERHEKLPF